MTIQSDEPRGAHLEPYAVIKSAILGHESAFAQPIVEAQIAAQLGLSRTPVREALRLLQSEGLVEHLPGKGWRVSRLSKDDIREIFELKLMLEPDGAGRAARLATDEERRELVRLAEQMREVAERGDGEAWLDADSMFHDLLLTCARNKRLSQTVQNLNAQWWRVHVGVAAMRGRMKLSTDEHMSIALAVAKGNAEQASRGMREHLQKLQDTLQDTLDIMFAMSN